MTDAASDSRDEAQPTAPDASEYDAVFHAPHTPAPGPVRGWRWPWNRRERPASSATATLDAPPATAAPEDSPAVESVATPAAATGVVEAYASRAESATTSVPPAAAMLSAPAAAQESAEAPSRPIAPAIPAAPTAPPVPPNEPRVTDVSAPPDRSEEDLPTGRPGPYIDPAHDIPVYTDDEIAASSAPPRRGGFATALVVVVAAALAFVTGLIVFNNMIMPRFIHSTAEVTVPDLANLTYDQAEQTLKPLGLMLSRAGERFDSSAPRGFVLSQDPLPDTPVRGRKRVMVVVSLGEEFSSVPSLFGESLRSARTLLARSGLRVSGITRAPSEEVGDGLVAGTDPPAESVLPRNATVAVLVSTGSGQEQYVMPELLGREIGGVRRHLESLGFRVTTPPSAPSVGSIVFQEPSPGSRINLDTPINLQAMGRIIR